MVVLGERGTVNTCGQEPECRGRRTFIQGGSRSSLGNNVQPVAKPSKRILAARNISTVHPPRPGPTKTNHFTGPGLAFMVRLFLATPVPDPSMTRSNPLTVAGALALVFCGALLPALPLQAQIADVRKSVVRVSTTSQDPDYKVPWNPGNIERGVGAGFIIAGPRIITNAHVISNARFITVERENDPKKYPAKVKFVAHDCDLAILEVADPAFFKGLQPLEIGGIPQAGIQRVGVRLPHRRRTAERDARRRFAHRFPGRTRHSAVDSHLACQIDAAINPGNSGGPVLQERQGRRRGVPGVQRRRGAERRLHDRHARHRSISSRTCRTAITTSTSIWRSRPFKPAKPRRTRARSGLKDDDTGMLVGAVVPGGDVRRRAEGRRRDPRAGRPPRGQRRVHRDRRRTRRDGRGRRAQVQGRPAQDAHPARQAGDGRDRPTQARVAVPDPGERLRREAALRALRRAAVPAAVARFPGGLRHRRPARALLLRFVRGPRASSSSTRRSSSSARCCPTRSTRTSRSSAIPSSARSTAMRSSAWRTSPPRSRKPSDYYVIKCIGEGRPIVLGTLPGRSRPRPHQDGLQRRVRAKPQPDTRGAAARPANTAVAAVVARCTRRQRPPPRARSALA